MPATVQQLGQGGGRRLGRKTRGNVVSTTQGVQHRCCHPPGFLRGLVAPGQRQAAQMPQPLPARPVNLQQFPAPGRTVHPQADAIQRQRQHRAGVSLFGADRGNMGMMVLHGEQRHPELRRQLLCAAG